MRRLFFLTALLGFAASAGAHPIDVGYLDLRSHGEIVSGTLELQAPLAIDLAHLSPDADLTPSGIAALAPTLFAATLGSGALSVDGHACTWGEPAVTMDALRIRIRAAARCPEAPGALRLTLPFVESTQPTFRLIGQSQLEGVHGEFLLSPGREVIALDGPPPKSLDQLLRTLLHALAPGAQLLTLLAALALGLSGALRERAMALGVFGFFTLVGIALGQHVALGVSATLLAGAAGTIGLALESSLATTPTRRGSLAAPAGFALGLACAPELRSFSATLGFALALLAASLLSILVLAVLRKISLQRVGAFGLALATVAIVLVAL